MRYVFTFFSCLFLTLFPPVADATQPLQGPIQAEVLRVIDGDTFDVRAQVWVGQFIETRVRLNGLDTPEIKGKCESEITRALEAKTALEHMVNNAPVYLDQIHNGKYAGRVIANAITQDNVDIAEQMITAGYARPYSGSTARKGWCGDEIVAQR